MAETSFPWENIDTTETQFSQMFRTVQNGVNGTPATDEVKVVAGFAGLTVDVEPGQAMVQGHFYINTVAKTLTLDTADGANDRIDTIVLRLDDIANEITAEVVTGTPAVNPVPPTLTQTEPYGVYEFPLADVLVEAAAGVPGTITDRRQFMGERVGTWTTANRPDTNGRPVFGYNITEDYIEFFDGTQWRPAFPIVDLDDLGDVVLTTPAANDFLVYDGSNWVNSPAGPSGLFYKADSNSVAFTAPTGSTVSIKAGTKVEIDGTVVDFATATAVTMPSLTAGSDYYIYAKSDGSAEAVLAMGIWPAPVASPPANSRLIGGFHFALGGNAPAQNGGDRVPVINPFSFWDLKWRPVALDPRGMTLVANRFWSDIYLLNRDPDQFGTSRAGQPIADGQTAGTTTAIVPAAFGGNGSTRYPTQSWWNTAECLSAYGKRLPRYSEFGSLAYGVKENHSVNSDPVDTGLIDGSGSGSGVDTNAERYTSKWGVIQATGTMWVWGDEFGGGSAADSFLDINGGRGRVRKQENAVRLGAAWFRTVNAGSRSSDWNASPSSSDLSIGGRGVCDHLSLA